MKKPQKTSRISVPAFVLAAVGLVSAAAYGQLTMPYDATAVRRPATCATGEFVKWDGTKWVCAVAGGGSTTGVVKAITVPFTFSSMGGTVSSTETVPENARVLRTAVMVDVAFTGGSGPTASVVVYHASGSTTLQGTTDNNLGVAGEYQTNATVRVPAGRGGVVRLTLGGTATAGSGEIVVTYVVPAT